MSSLASPSWVATCVEALAALAGAPNKDVFKDTALKALAMELLKEADPARASSARLGRLLKEYCLRRSPGEGRALSRLEAGEGAARELDAFLRGSPRRGGEKLRRVRRLLVRLERSLAR